jgi:hypothetical protein
MSWRLSRFRAGDLVEVRGWNEIAETLDQNGTLEGLPFMPEMLKYCGQQYRVAAVAHKACDMITKPRGRSRRMDATVHLVALRCDGSAHGGCQAECNIFWKDAWLQKADPAARRRENPAPVAAPEPAIVRLRERTLFEPAPGETEARYSCQATRLHGASRPLPWWDARQYFFDTWTRNRTLGKVCGVLFLATLRTFLRHLPFGYRSFKKFNDAMHRKLTGRETPWLNARVQKGMATPVGYLGLQPGEMVRIKSQDQIEQTLDATGRNRGLTFDCEEMAPYCGGVFKVRSRVTTIIEEDTGRMLHMKQPCIMLEGVVCKSEYASCRLNCPRAIPSYWRELWLERVGTEA